MTFSDVDIDDVQRYWTNRPCNIRHSTAPIGSRRFFLEADERKQLVEPHIADFAQYHRWKGRRVLEIGCGIGHDTQRFAEAGAHVTAIDLSPLSVALSRRRQEIFGYDVNLLCGDAETMRYPLAERSFDLVYSFGVIHHTPHPERVVARMRRMVAPDGLCKVMVYNRHSWKALRLAGLHPWRFDERVAQSSEAESGCPVTYSYSRRGGRQLLRHGGFEIIDTAVDHIFPYRVEDYVEYRYVKTLAARLPGFRMAERLLGWHLMLTAVPR